MFSSKALRTAGLMALCVLMSVVFSGAWGGAQQQPIPPLQVIVKGDPAFDPLVSKTPTNRIPSVGAARSLDDGSYFLTVKECGTMIVGIAIDPEARKIQDPVAAARSLDDGPIPLGAARSLDDPWLLGGKGEFPKGDYYFWLEEAGKLGIKPPPELGSPFHWYTTMGTVSADGKKDIVAILYYPDELFRTPEEWLRAIGSAISLKDKRCDLTVRHLSVTATKIPGPPCRVPPCPPPQWNILALATIANIGQIDVQEPFTVRCLLNGRLIHEEEIANLPAGASQPVLASATVGSPGLYIVTVIIDPENKINERDETNNIAERIINIR